MITSTIFGIIGAVLAAGLYIIKRFFDGKAEKQQQAGIASAAKGVADASNANSQASSEVSSDTSTNLNKDILDAFTKTSGDRAAVKSGRLARQHRRHQSRQR